MVLLPPPARSFETLEPEMNNLASRVAAVNRIADQLLAADQRNQESIRDTREQLNARWAAGGLQGGVLQAGTGFL